MSSRLMSVFRLACRAALAASVLLSAILLLWMGKVLPWPERTIPLTKIRATEGYGFTSKLPKPWPAFTFVGPSGVLTEDGRELTPVKGNGLVRQDGLGAFRVGGERVLFSSSDGSDPLKNGRAYLLRVPTVVPPPLRPLILGVGAIAGFLLFGKILRRVIVRLRPAVAERAGGVPAISASKWALALFVLALTVRAGFILLNPDYTDEQMSIRGVPYSDASDWNRMAKSTALGTRRPRRLRWARSANASFWALTAMPRVLAC